MPNEKCTEKFSPTSFIINNYLPTYLTTISISDYIPFKDNYVVKTLSTSLGEIGNIATFTLDSNLYQYFENNAKIRVSYQEKVQEIAEKAAFYKEHGIVTLDAAKELFDLRQEVKQLSQDQMNPLELAFVKLRQLFTYGQSSGPSFEKLLKTKSLEQIMESAGRTGGENLGLKSDEFKNLMDCVKNQKTINSDYYVTADSDIHHLENVSLSTIELGGISNLTPCNDSCFMNVTPVADFIIS